MSRRPTGERARRRSGSASWSCALSNPRARPYAPRRPGEEGSVIGRISRHVLGGAGSQHPRRGVLLRTFSIGVCRSLALARSPHRGSHDCARRDWLSGSHGGGVAGGRSDVVKSCGGFRLTVAVRGSSRVVVRVTYAASAESAPRSRAPAGATAAHAEAGEPEAKQRRERARRGARRCGQGAAGAAVQGEPAPFAARRVRATPSACRRAA